MEMGYFETRLDVRLNAFDKLLCQGRPICGRQEECFLKKLIHGCWHLGKLHRAQSYGNT